MTDLDTTAINTVDSPKDFGTGPEGVYRRWSVELAMAKKRMKDWRTTAKKQWDIYHGKSVSRKKNSFNVLWSNTEILAPSVYNTLPTPDIRRRFGQSDPLGKAVSEVISRSLTFNAETTCFGPEVEDDILDMLIAGRGFSRVRYVPDLVQVGDTQQTGIEDNETNLEHEAQEGEQNEELAWESAPIEHVRWDRYLHGPGRGFKEIPWWAFEHDLTRRECVDRFGEEIGNTMELNGGPADTDVDRERMDDQTMELFKTAKVWEIWDKDSRTVIWIADSGYAKGPLKTEEDPLKLQGFFPLVNPLRAIADSDKFDPVTLYEQYKEQAEELDRVSTRINKIISGLKLRAVYDPALGDQVAELFRGEDNDLIPADASIKQLYEAGGIASAIWWAPVEQAAKVLEALRAQRDACKEIIFELTGLADIMRGASDPSETKGAQDLKVAFGMTRLSRMQRSVQAYIRDLFALQAEVICERFSLETLQKMTQMQLPTDAQVALQRGQMLRQAIAAHLQGQQVPPLPPKPITWEDVHRVMQDDIQRTFRVDIETDSTIAAAQQEDAADLQAVLSAIVELVKEVGPMVQEGVLPFPAFKELLLMSARKFRMGSQIEDAIDAMQPPPPPKPDPKLQIPLQVEQLRQQGKKDEIAAQVQAKGQEAQIDAQVALHQQQVQAAQAQQENALESQRAAMQAQNEGALEQMRMQHERAIEEMKQTVGAQLQLFLQAMKNQSAVEVAEITTGAQLQAAQISAANQGDGQ